MGWFRKKAAGDVKAASDDRLLGRWTIDPADAAAVAAFGDVALEFDEAGRLNYLVRADGAVQAILMTYRVDGEALVTDQPSQPRPERTAYRIGDDGALTLTFGGVPSRFLRRR